MISSQSSFRKRAKSKKESNTFSTTRKSSAYNRDFEQHLINHDIYPEEYDNDEDSEESTNMKDINQRLTQSRSSLSSSRFTREQFLNFKKKNRKALTKNKVMSKVFSIIADTVDILSQKNLSFGNFKDLTNDFIIKDQSDFYDESRSVNLNKRIRNELESYVVSSTNTVASCVLNFYTGERFQREYISMQKSSSV